MFPELHGVHHDGPQPGHQRQRDQRHHRVSEYLDIIYTIYTIYRCELYTNLLDPGAACWLDTVGWEDRKKEDMESFREDAVTTQ